MILVHRQCPWSAEWVERAGIMITKRRAEKHRFVKVLFLGGPREAWLWSDLGDAMRSRLAGLGLVEMALPSWNDVAVRQWKKEAEFGENTDEDSRRFTEATGNWCLFLHEVGRRCGERPHEWKSILEGYRRELLADPSTLQRFGIVPESLPVLRVMAEYQEPVTIDELVGLIDMTSGSVSREDVARVLRWSDQLCMVRSAGDQRWALDPMLNTLLMNRPNHAQ